MAGDSMDIGEGYSSMMGLMYVFNLIVGTGALAMPSPIAEAGWLLSLIILIVLAFMSFVTVTFMTESMAAANAVLHFRTVKHLKKIIKNEDVIIDDCGGQQLVEQFDNDEVICNSAANEKVPLLLNSVDTIAENSTEYFNITERIEMGKMAMLFFNKIGVNIFYVCIAIYLYGDLAIYAAAVSKSLKDVTCFYTPSGACNVTKNNSVSCWNPDIPVTRGDAYRIYLLSFLLLLGPFTFFNVQKTKYLQVFTSLMRWLAFSTMIILAATAIIKGKGKGHPPIASLSGVPNLFGVCVYSFMCHHSLPSLITPIRDKSRIFRLFVIDYSLILVFYCLLSFTGIFAFDQIRDVYTLNFEPQNCNTSSTEESIVPESADFLRYFLALFPVFTLSTNFPIIAITLRNNLKSIFLNDNRNYSFFVQKLLFPLLAVVPPMAIAFITEDLTILVGITGSYAGAAIQYIIPALLVLYSRKSILASLGVGVTNRHASPFRHVAWIYFVLFWAAMCIVFVTVNHIITQK
ncbi:transmembrane protein 104 isoform X1 [Parasteatoda tepidariorum]|uniref:transmembrane protein 104 isoform X1 n=1 Tax=Parasteatoda tepidariorum TaxID=114398 RepID=UPI000A2C029E|nr:transmembrane protein 104 [Parasteatoda tepidariorum]